MITDFKMTRGNAPTTPDAVSVALEASVANDRAAAIIAASWAMAETFTGQTFYPVTAASGVANMNEGGDVTWPRYPFPADLVIERWEAGAWLDVTDDVDHVPEFGLVVTLTAGRYRFTQVGTVTPPTPAAHVVEAVRALALYQLIHSPARREFRQMNAGDSSLTRESLDGLFRASGAGILLAGEVRW